MPTDLRVSEIRFIPSNTTEVAVGLLGFASFLLNDAVQIDGVTVRRTLAGEVRLSWPTRTDRLGAKHAFVRPITDDVRRDLEAQVIAALGLGASGAGMSPRREQGDSPR